MRFALLAVAVCGLLAACSSGTAASTGPAAGPAAKTAQASQKARTTDPSCSHGVTEGQPGVARVDCDGTATIHITVGDISREFHGGDCHSVGDVWSAAAGVVVDVTGSHGKYTGPPVENVVVNQTTTKGLGTIQSVLGGKNYYDLGEARMTIASDGKTARLVGSGHQFSDAPGKKITVTVNC
jgi:hypothetical protein